METTTIRVDRGTHAGLVEMSRSSGDSLTETVRQAADALRRLRFGLQVQQQYADLRRDPEAWASYLTELESTHVSDGVD
ncbi:hypothetical protein [Candidatus Poriferisodalis sp.]|uniref:hypothetical protein n=1 Tax=Candidatus Poriferisodalis sp. TaxID=3101277 RepID=UPI003AF7B0C8